MRSAKGGKAREVLPADLPWNRRQALAMAVDRELLTERITGTGELPAYGWVPPIPGYTPQRPEWADWPMERRLEEARRLFAEAGYGEDRPLTVELYYNTSDNHKRIALAVAVGAGLAALTGLYAVFGVIP